MMFGIRENPSFGIKLRKTQETFSFPLDSNSPDSAFRTFHVSFSYHLRWTETHLRCVALSSEVLFYPFFNTKRQCGSDQLIDNNCKLLPA